MIGYIYRITNIVNNKCYVGITEDFARRQKKHIAELRKNKHHSPKLQNAWNYYGENNFEWTVRKVDINKYDDLYDYEIAEIKKYNSYYDGYNCNSGGRISDWKQKVKNEDIIRFLCIQWKYGDGYGKTCEDIFGWSRGTASAAKRKIRFIDANIAFENMDNKKRTEIAEETFEKYKIKTKALTRKLNQGGCAKAYQLTQDDYNFAFCAEELGYDYQPVAQYLGIKPSTVKDWFRRGVHASEKEKYYSLPESQKNTIKEKVRNAHLEAIGHDKITEEKEKQIIQYLCYCEFYKPVKKQIERVYNWASGTIRGIEIEGRYPITKAKFNLLSEEEKRKEAEELCQRLAV